MDKSKKNKSKVDNKPRTVPKPVPKSVKNNHSISTPKKQTTKKENKPVVIQKASYEMEKISAIPDINVPFNVFSDGSSIPLEYNYTLVSESKAVKKNAVIENAITVYAPPGIGDALWPLQFIIENTNRPICLKTYKRPGFASKFLLGIKNVVSVEEFTSIGDIKFKNYQEYVSFVREKEKEYAKLENLDSIDEMYMEVNVHIEQGNRIEEFLPNLKCSFSIPWEISVTDKAIVDKLIGEKKIVLIYSSSYKNNNMDAPVYKEVNFAIWNGDNWVTIVDGLLEKIDDDTRIVWVGAPYDFDQSKYTMSKLTNPKKDQIIHLNDLPCGVFIELLHRSECFISYQSGLSVISLIEQIPTEMFWFKCLDKMHQSFCHPNMINNSIKYKDTRFDDYKKEESMKWLSNYI